VVVKNSLPKKWLDLDLIRALNGLQKRCFASGLSQNFSGMSQNFSGLSQLSRTQKMTSDVT